MKAKDTFAGVSRFYLQNIYCFVPQFEVEGDQLNSQDQTNPHCKYVNRNSP